MDKKHGPIYHFPTTDEVSPFIIQFMGINYCYPDYFNARQNSQFTVLAYVLSGQGNIRINSKLYHPQQGDTFILPFGSTHEVFANFDQKEEWTYIWYNITGSWLLNVLEAYHLRHVTIVPNASVEGSFRKGIHEIQTKPLDMLQKSFSLIIMEIVLTLSDSYLQNKSRHSTEVQNILKELDHYIHQPFHSELLSKTIGLSFKQINRLFKKEMNTTVYNYILKGKIDAATLMLRDTQMNISEIAYQLGYANPNYFSSLFKLKTGLSPNEFRNK